MPELPYQDPDEWRLAVTTLDGQSIELHQLLDRLPAGAYLCDHNGLIAYYNRRAVELWGRTPKVNDPEDRFCGWFRLYSADDGSALRHDQCWMAVALREEKEYSNREIIIEHPDGKRLTILANINPIWDYARKLLGAISVLTDITHWKRPQEMQR